MSDNIKKMVNVLKNEYENKTSHKRLCRETDEIKQNDIINDRRNIIYEKHENIRKKRINKSNFRNNIRKSLLKETIYYIYNKSLFYIDN